MKSYSGHMYFGVIIIPSYRSKHGRISVLPKYKLISLIIIILNYNLGLPKYMVIKISLEKKCFFMVLYILPNLEYCVIRYL